MTCGCKNNNKKKQNRFLQQPIDDPFFYNHYDLTSLSLPSSGRSTLMMTQESFENTPGPHESQAMIEQAKAKFNINEEKISSVKSQLGIDSTKVNELKSKLESSNIDTSGIKDKLLNVLRNREGYVPHFSHSYLSISDAYGFKD